VRAPRPTGVRVGRLPHNKRIITWHGPRKLSYVIAVRSSDGRFLRYLRPGGKRRVIVDAVPGGARLRARVSAVSSDGMTGPAGHAQG
jgi:hypothetical protein